jgi:phytoene dehydrogenase-like protein
MTVAKKEGSPPLGAVVVGSGPNGLAAAVVVAARGHRVLVLEGKETVGGGCRTAELTLPGFRHDVCSAVHPLGATSPLFRSLPLKEHGLTWVHPDVPLAHPLDDGSAVILGRSVDDTAVGLGRDRAAYRRLVAPLAEKWWQLAEDILAPLGVPRHPLVLARFGLAAVRSVRDLVVGHFQGERARALFAGMAAHGALALDRAGTAAFALTLVSAGHAVGWPIAKGGSQAIADALASHLTALGGEIRVGSPVSSSKDLPESRAVLFDVTPRQLLSIVGPALPAWYRSRLRGFRFGPGVFKLDWALGDPIPWKARECARAATVHLGGTFEEIFSSERTVSEGGHPDRPYVLVGQPTLFDPCRAPEGKHTAWAYCHVPHGSRFDMTDRIEDQVDRFAPGFRDCILARSALSPTRLEEHNPNLVGGDISGGVSDLRQIFFRPRLWSRAYEIPGRGWYLCSSSTPPGGGVHGMCGFHAARLALRGL